MLHSLIALLLYVAPTLSPHGREGCEGLRTITVPERPRPGTLFRVFVEGVSPSTTIRGSAADERLHFTGTGARREAIAAVPIEAGKGVSVVLWCTTGGREDSTTTPVVLARADYPVERLRVDPRFSATPDAALEARMRRESGMAAEVGRRSHDTPRLWMGAFNRPRDSRVTSTFGRGREFNGTLTSRHMGTDYAGAVGAVVRAPNRGVVRLVESFFVGGNVVYVDHGEGLVTAYLHLSEQSVAVGDTVRAGDVIGRVGATGRVTGPHLHWIVRYGGITVDPASLLRITR